MTKYLSYFILFVHEHWHIIPNSTMKKWKPTSQSLVGGTSEYLLQLTPLLRPVSDDYFFQLKPTHRLFRSLSQLHRPLWPALVGSNSPRHHFFHFLRFVRNIGGDHWVLRIQFLWDWFLPDDNRSVSELECSTFTWLTSRVFLSHPLLNP